MKNSAVVGEFQPMGSAPVVEPGLYLKNEPHGPAHDAHQPHQSALVGRLAFRNGHEVEHLAHAVGGHEPRDQYGRVGKVQLSAHVVVPVRTDPEISSAVFIEQRGENARRVEAGTAEPVYGSIGTYQRRCLQVADQAMIADKGVIRSFHDRPPKKVQWFESQSKPFTAKARPALSRSQS